MKRIAVILLGVALALPACNGSLETGRPIETVGPISEPDARIVAIYSTIIRQLVTKDHTFGDEESPFDRVFIDVRIDGGAGNSDASPPTGATLSAEDQAAILRELADLPPVEFVENPDSVIVGKNRCPHVKGDGVLITLGPISGDSERVTVPNDMFFACLGGLWITYVLENEDGHWRVTGTEGGIGIS